jgi:hypothetical protein
LRRFEVESDRSRRPGGSPCSTTSAPDLDEARAKIEATRAALQAALDGQEAPDERLTALVARLDRMAAKVERVEDAVTAHLPVGEAITSAK